MSNSYFNTTGETGQDLKNSEEKAMTQEDKILAFFKDHPLAMYTPTEILQYCFTSATPITSVRRSMTVLTKKTLLRKTATQKKGSYGKMTYCWRLVQYKLES